MNFKTFKEDSFNQKKLPDSIYKSVVNSLYEDPRSLAIGIFCCVAGALVLFWKTFDIAQLIFAVTFLSIGIVRLLLSISFIKATKVDLPVAAYRAWENNYNKISTLYIAILGAWYATGLIRSDDSFVQLLSLSLILCYLIGIMGRNFASNKVVRSQVITSIVMLIGSAVLYDDIYGIVLMLFLLPFLFAIHFMSTRLRRMLFKAEINAFDSNTIANRFDVALDNVMHGIAMVDKDSFVIVANSRFMVLAGMGDWEISGCKISILDTVEITESEYSNLGDCLTSCLQSEQSKIFSFNLLSGAAIEAEYNPTGDGGVIVLSDVSQRKASEKVIKNLADFDALTGLSNRRNFIENVERYIQSNQDGLASSMYFIDLDKFKEVNDTFGHAFGDELLQVISSRLKTLLFKDELICRFGGDEFVIFCPGLSDMEGCSAFAKRILKELHQPVTIRSNNIDIGCSIGVAVSPHQDADANLLLKEADAALYESKHNGRAIYTFYTADLGDSIRKKRELETDLRQALRNDEIDVHFQPLLDIKNSTISSCEALARWNHPTLGNVSPGVFIELAEEMGLILLLGENILRKSMRECLKWPDEVSVAVNVSSIQFQRSDVYQLVKKLLHETGLPAHKLTIEVTESVMIESAEDISKTLHQLSNLGVYISLDDFGTGFSNLSYLHELPFDKVKIDKSFVDNAIANPRSLVLLQGVVDLLKRSGFKIVLEGIETQDQLLLLEKNVQVHEYQGYLFFKPMPADNALTILNQAHVIQNEAVRDIAWR